MKKKMKKVISLVLALALTLGMSAAVYADENSTSSETTSSETTSTATIKNETQNNYIVYQLLIGDVDENGDTLSNIKAGKNLNVDNIKNAMAAAENSTYTSVDSISSDAAAAYFADTLESMESNVDGAITQYAYQYVTGDGTTIEAGEQENMDCGYYLVIKTSTVTYEDDTEATVVDDDYMYILQIIGGTYSIDEKKNGDATPEKKILVETETETGTETKEVDGTTAAIGDTITFQLTAALPSDFSSYTEYKLTMNDTMSEGLTYEGISSIKIGDSTFEVSTEANSADGSYNIYYTETDTETETETTVVIGTISTEDVTDEDVTDDEGTKTLLTIAFDNLVGVPGAADGADVVVVYTATLNENATTGYDANTNTLNVTYSNNPSNTSSYENSQDDTVYVYTFKLTVNKVKDVDSDGDGDKDPLEGAGFTLYMLTGTDEEGNEVWEAVQVGTENEGTENESAVYEITGVTEFTFSGLDVGTYKLVETTTPDGYNTADPIYFTISATVNEYGELQSGSNNNISVSSTDDTDEAKVINLTSANSETGDAGGDLVTTVINYAGNDLPETGGMGTTLIYIIGAALIVGACVALVVSRKKKASRQ